MTTAPDTASSSLKSSSGLTIIELLIALVLIGVAFFALALTQVTALRASSRTGTATEVKAAANGKLEELMAEVLKADIVGAGSSYWDQYDSVSGKDLSFWFIDYYYSCPNVVIPQAGRTALRGGVACSGTETSGEITTSWALSGGSGVLGEGVIDIVVTATHAQGGGVTLGDTVTCYDVYPSPTKDTPVPCPVPTAAGGGR